MTLIAAAASAQDAAPEGPPDPDFSRDTLLRLFADNPEREAVEPRVKVSFGAIEFRAAGARWRIGYLPFFMPLPGSIPWDHEQRWPDPFALTGTQIASPPRTWRDNRAKNAEMRRIERKLRESATVTVTPE
ncbi:MAG TPA: hypothetical protein VFT12_04585 [Thermoanaerobaculia bacterium]|nr:hypothetical protein [Thermoanaerobaculia bacterium]